MLMIYRMKPWHTDGADMNVMTSKERLNLLQVEMWLLKASGILPSADISPWKAALYSMYTATLFLCYIPALLGQFFAVYRYRGNVEMLVELTYQLSGTVNTFSLGAALYFNRAKFTQLFNYLEEGFVEYMEQVCPAEHRNALIKKSTKRASALTWTLIGTNGFTLISWIFAPPYYRYSLQLGNSTEVAEEEIEDFWQYFTWICWLPPNALEHPIYDCIWVYQAFVIYATLVFFTCYLTLGSAVLIHTATNFQILTAAMEYIKAEDVEYGNLKAVSAAHPGEHYFHRSKNAISIQNANVQKKETKGSRFQEVKKSATQQANEMESALMNWIKYHQDLLDFCDDLNQAFSPLHFIFFIVNLSCTCMSAFQFAVGSAGHKGLKFFAASVNAWVPLLIICLHGEHLTTQSNALYNAVCGSQWYNQSPTFKRMIQIIIMASQKPLYFTASKFYTVSLEAFGQMANTVYAYFTVLMQMSKND